MLQFSLLLTRYIKFIFFFLHIRQPKYVYKDQDNLCCLSQGSTHHNLNIFLKVFILVLTTRKEFNILIPNHKITCSQQFYYDADYNLCFAFFNKFSSVDTNDDFIHSDSFNVKATLRFHLKLSSNHKNFLLPKFIIKLVFEERIRN